MVSGKKEVFRGQTQVFGDDAASGLHLHTADFTRVTEPGTYQVIADGQRSWEFTIGEDVYRQLAADALGYFYLARSGIEISADVVAKAYARPAGHVGRAEGGGATQGAQAKSPNQGDYAVPCLQCAEAGENWPYGDWACPAGYTRDVVGGWYDAGDHGKYVVSGAFAAAQRMSAYERTLGSTGEGGSDAAALNNQVLMASAYDISGEEKHAAGALEGMDYLLGRNALAQSYITGYGVNAARNQHCRWYAHQLDPTLPPPPPGTLAGGTNSQRETWDPALLALYPAGVECAPQACYVDHVESWASNEVAINWNSALVWMASFADTYRR